MTGKKGKDLYVKVPLGTIVKEKPVDYMLVCKYVNALCDIDVESHGETHTYCLSCCIELCFDQLGTCTIRTETSTPL